MQEQGPTPSRGPEQPFEPPSDVPAAPAPPAVAPPSGGRLESFSLIDRESRRRRETDQQLSYAMFLVLGFVTFGIYAIYVHFKLIERQQNHFKRMGRFNDDLLKLVNERATDIG